MRTRSRFLDSRDPHTEALFHDKMSNPWRGHRSHSPHAASRSSYTRHPMAFQPSIYRGTGLNLRLILASHAMQRELREPDPCITGITVNPVQTFALALMIDESCSRDETKLGSQLC